MLLFENSEPEEFLLLLHNVYMLIEASVVITADGTIQYLYTMFCWKALNGFENFLGHIGHTTNIFLDNIILVLGIYIFSINAISKQKNVIYFRMRK